MPIDDNPNIAVGDTVKKYSWQLFYFIKGKTKTIEDAEDILQEVWYQLSRFANLDELGNVSAWLFSISRNKITEPKQRRKKYNDGRMENNKW